MKKLKSTFALFFGNRGFFPISLIAEARKEVSETLKKLGYEFLMMDKNLTRFGAVESPQEGRYAWARRALNSYPIRKTEQLVSVK